ncbi:MAG: FlgD immunoglobulin-like domain containing protein [bacterium]
MSRARSARLRDGLTLGTALSVSLALSASAATFTNFESHQIHPLALSADGARLFAVNTPDNRLTVYAITPAGLAIEAEIPVGLEPVAVRPRTPNEVWVVNHLSDDVSVIDLTTMNVRATVFAGDEPTDVVFAGSAARAFVCVSQEDAIKIFDANDLEAPPVVVPLFGSDPRALATNADASRVYAAIFEGGNRTSILHATEVVAGGGPPAPNPPKLPSLPAAPEVGLIVQWNGANWLDETGAKNWNAFVPIPYTLPDYDVAVLDANAPSPSPSYFAGAGTLNFNLAVHPSTGRVYVANTEAINLTRFEPNLRGRFAQNRVTIIDPSSGSVTPVHLNPHINYAVSPGPPSEIAQSLSQPNAGEWDAPGANLYLAAIGSGKVAVLDAAGAVTARADAGEGPSAVVVDNARARLYVLDRFTNRVLTLDKSTLNTIGSVGLGYQPEPAVITEGRKFLYDARITSAHGDLACASCHAFANFDNIAWDLGDPTGAMQPSPQFGVPPFHPMKGPMTTQSLRGLAATEPFHWRGDRAGFNDFNPAFTSLMGAGAPLLASDMQAFTDFIMTVVYPPNPNQNLDRTYPNPAAPTPSAERGRFEFTTEPHDASLRCQDCHQSAPTDEPFRVAPGTNSLLIPGPALQESQAFKVPQMRNLYEKTGFSDAPGPQKRGFGFIHDGAIDDLFDFVSLPVFQFETVQQKRDIEAFMLAFDTGTAPAVGAQQTLDGTNANAPEVVARVNTLVAQANAGNVDLVAKGRVGGIARGYVYSGGGAFESDRAADAPILESALRTLAAAGAEITYTAVPPGNGTRIGVDRDCDGYRDRDEIDAGSNPADAASTPVSVEPPGAPDSRPVKLAQNSPNPMGDAGTTIAFTLASPADASVRVYDASGREVAVLLPRSRQQGTVSLRWDGRDSRGALVSAGVYFYRVEAAGRTESRRLVILR